MSFYDDFKKFAMRGNVVDLAVGVIIGGAFGKIVTALVNDIIMPAIRTTKKILFIILYCPANLLIIILFEEKCNYSTSTSFS